MIGRYTLPDMGRVWSEAHKYELWCRVETMVLEAHAAAGVVPADCVEPVRRAAPPTPEAVDEIELVTQHDVIAFLSAWADNTAPRSAAAYVHFGMTSSDLLDLIDSFRRGRRRPAYRVHTISGYDARSGVRLEHERLDSAPQLVLVRLGPDAAHLGQRVTTDH